jgi:hypothetical protein
MPFLCAFGGAWDDAMVARWSAKPFDKFWPETDRHLNRRNIFKQNRSVALVEWRQLAA